MIRPLLTFPGGWELVLIILVIVLLFGAKKLPELARGTGQALRIFKTETKGLRDDDTEDTDERGAGADRSGATRGAGGVDREAEGSSGPTPKSLGPVAEPSPEAVARERRDTSNG